MILILEEQPELPAVNTGGIKHIGQDKSRDCSASSDDNSRAVWRSRPDTVTLYLGERAVNKETYLLLKRNALQPQQGLRSRLEKPERRGRILPSLYGLTRLDGPQKTEALSYLYTPSLSQALSTPETRLCCSTNSLSGFTSITITARRVSLSVPSLLSPEIRTQNQRNKLPVPSASTMSTCDDTTQQASVSWGNPAVLLKHQATMVKVTENRERDYPGKRFASSLAFPVCRNSYTESKTTSQALARSKEEPALGRSFPSVSEHLIFHSCLHLELLPGPFSSMLYLDKSLSISLARLQEGGRTLHRSTLSLYIRGALRPGCPESPGVRPLSRAHSGWGMVTHGHKIMRDGYRHLEGVTTVDSEATGGGRSPGSAALPFRAGHHSSSAVFRPNGKANDVSQPRRGGAEGPVNSGVNVRTSSNGRGPCSCAETVLREQAGPVSPHVFDYTGEPNSTNHWQALSIKEALEHFRPDFISRSQKRVRQLEERTRERQRSQTADFAVELEGTNKRWNCTKPHPLSGKTLGADEGLLNTANGIRQRGETTRLCSFFSKLCFFISSIYNKLPEVTKRKEEERRKLVLQTNRLRAEVFKKVEQGP
ncbi:hypothetical protein P4O66_011857 [Electrophorus voltai]|uniref:ALMS motif domain-containing protein n=1 Tax=Electrophorus voltai TaxID=2609070 RepID=A0AAD8Z8P6_9TELE|nr:hypothetical protein P4O66_011857 [Electrophorus voltai]